MKIIFAKGTLAKLKFLAISDNEGSGFLKTERIGKYIMITDLIHGNISNGRVKKDLVNIYDLWGYDFGGIFQKRKLKKPPEYFLEKLILTLTKDTYQIFHYDSDRMVLNKITKGTFNPD